MPELEQTLRAMVSDEALLEQLLSIKTPQNQVENPPQTPQSEGAASQAFKAAELLTSVLLPRQTPQTATDIGEGSAAGEIREKIEKSNTFANSEAKSPAVSLTAMAQVVPQIMQAISGDSSMLPCEKVNLVRALRPYTSHRESIDRAIKMAGIAKAAKAALGTLKKP